MYADRLMNTYVKLATSGPVVSELVDKLGIILPPTIKVVTVPNTELIQISVESTSPVLAQEAANTLGDILVAQSKELYSGGGKSLHEILEGQLAQAEAELKQARLDYETLTVKQPDNLEEIAAASKTLELREKTYANLLEEHEQALLRDARRANTISVVEQATTPLSPSRPNKMINISLGLIMGLCGGIGLVFLMENWNKRLYTSEQIESVTGMTILSKIPKVENKSIILSFDSQKSANVPLREAFCRLRTNILSQGLSSSGGAPLHTFMVTSAEPGEGKSIVSVNLAMVMAQSGQTVILVDADLRLPSLHKYLQLPNSYGLSSILSRGAHLREVVQASPIPGLSVITSGPLPPNPADLLGSPGMKSLIDELSEQYDLALIDTPAYLPVTDAAVLAPLAGGVVLVVQRIAIHENALREVCRHLEDINIQPVGIVVNQAEASGSYYYHKS
jgi:non-specific protein-tyrosine kinase